MTAADRLDVIEARADAATDGPWEGDYGHFGTGIVAGRVRTGPNVIGSMWRPSDGTFTAHARTDVPRLVAALRAVLDLEGEYVLAALSGHPEDVRAANVATYIRRAVETALGEVAS